VNAFPLHPFTAQEQLLSRPFSKRWHPKKRPSPSSRRSRLLAPKVHSLKSSRLVEPIRPHHLPFRVELCCKFDETSPTMLPVKTHLKRRRCHLAPRCCLFSWTKNNYLHRRSNHSRPPQQRHQRRDLHQYPLFSKRKGRPRRLRPRPRPPVAHPNERRYNQPERERTTSPHQVRSRIIQTSSTRATDTTKGSAPATLLRCSREEAPHQMAMLIQPCYSPSARGREMPSQSLKTSERKRASNVAGSPSPEAVRQTGYKYNRALHSQHCTMAASQSQLSLRPRYHQPCLNRSHWAVCAFRGHSCSLCRRRKYDTSLIQGPVINNLFLSRLGEK